MKKRKSTHLLLAVSVLVTATLLVSCTRSGDQPDSRFEGVQVGVITYSWRSMPSTPDDIIRYCRRTGISSVELMGSVAESYAGAPAGPPRPENWGDLGEEERSEYREEQRQFQAELMRWRTSTDHSEAYREIKEKFDEAGIGIHIVKFSPGNWPDEAIDYAFESAKIMGAKGVSNEIGHEACRRLGPIAEKHDMVAVFHNHGQPGNPEFDFRDFLAYSPANMLNLDVGHFFGATGIHPNALIEELHERIFSLHLKDKTARDADPPDTNMPWGEGDTPLADILTLVRDNGWPIYCDIELEYPVPEGSDAVREVGKCVEFCREVLIRN